MKFNLKIFHFTNFVILQAKKSFDQILFAEVNLFDGFKTRPEGSDILREIVEYLRKDSG